MTSSTKKSKSSDPAQEQINSFLKWGGRLILGVMIVGAMGAARGVYDDVAKLKTEKKYIKEKVTENKAEIKKMQTKVNQIHWYLIERNGVKVPAKTK